jgi:tripartite-type tricarboxylate transporter receptor subunit TctC
MRRSLLASIAALLVTPAAAQTPSYPSQQIKLIVPFAAGGVTDLVGRLAGEHIRSRTGQAVIVENRPGASGNTGMAAVAASTPDGYTIGLVSINTWAVNPLMFKSMPYDPHKDLVAVAAVAEAPQILVVHSSVPARTLQEFIAYAKANPGKVNHGTAGIGTSNHLGADTVFRQAGIDIPHVHYRGGGPAVTDLVTGAMQVACVAVGLVIGHVHAGTLRPIAAVAPKRLPFIPDLPTTAEAGLPSYDTSNWFGIAAPAKTPRVVVETLNRLLVSMADDEAIQKRIAAAYMLPMRLTPAELAASIEADTPKWAKIVRDAGIKPE